MNGRIHNVYNLCENLFQRTDDVRLSCVCPVIDNEFLHCIVKEVCGSSSFDILMDRRKKNGYQIVN